MAELADLPLKYRLLIEGYPFRNVDWRPGSVLSKPLTQARIALITSAGFFLPTQPPFDKSYRHDDCSFREIPDGTPVESLRIGQTSDAFDPADRLRELIAEGLVGESASRHFSIMGSLIAPAKLISESGPEIARKLQDDRVDAVLLAPV
jgi:D-proline reductase (dithiol) PrdB